MPLYTYCHPETDETIEVVQGMKDKHFYIDENGVEWKRVWESHGLGIDNSFDPYSQNDFVNKTKNKNYSVGDMWDLSRSLHEKRKAKEGKDPIKAKHNQDRSKQMNEKRLRVAQQQARRNNKGN